MKRNAKEDKKRCRSDVTRYRDTTKSSASEHSAARALQQTLPAKFVFTLVNFTGQYCIPTPSRIALSGTSSCHLRHCYILQQSCLKDKIYELLSEFKKLSDKMSMRLRLQRVIWASVTAFKIC